MEDRKGEEKQPEGKRKGLGQAVVSQHTPAQVPWQVNLALGTDILAKAREEQAVWSKKQTTGETIWAAVWEQVGFSSSPQKPVSSLGQAGYRLWACPGRLHLPVYWLAHLFFHAPAHVFSECLTSTAVCPGLRPPAWAPGMSSDAACVPTLMELIFKCRGQATPQ